VKHLRKTSLLLAISLIVILGLTLNLARAETATIFVYPQRTIGDLTPAPGSTLNLDFNVSDVTEPMWGYQFFLRFDPVVFPRIIPLTNMNFTDTASTAWTTTTVGTVVGTAASGYDGANGNPSPGSGAPSYYLKATASITEAASITFSTEQTFTYNGKTPIKAVVSFAYRITGTSLGAGSTIGLRVVKPDATFKTLISTYSITSADLAKPWQFNITDTSLSAFDKVGTYKFQLRTTLKTANAGTFNYLQVNWDDVGVWTSSAGGVSEGPFLKAGGTTDFIVKYINESAVYIADSLTIPPPGGVTGSGKLASVSLVVSYGRSWLDLAGVKLIKLGDPPNYPPVEMAYTATDGYFDNRIPGDVNSDRWVTSADFSILQGAYGTSRGQPNYDERADFNLDGYITSADFSVLQGNYGRHYP